MNLPWLCVQVADLSSTGGEGGAGAIIAALYLREFVKEVPRCVRVQGNRSSPGAFECRANRKNPPPSRFHSLNTR